jgi:hypothetical protein
MNTDQRIVLRLEVDRDADPITGTLTQCGHAKRPFTGWLALSNVIESIRTGEGESMEAFRGPTNQETTGTGGDGGQREVD